jgi:hypothetical protein
MRDHFGADTPASDGSPAATPPIPAAAIKAPAVAVAVPAVAPTLAQAVDKAVAKAAADVKVAEDPHAVHSVRLAVAAPTVLGSTAVGALIGSAIFPGPGTLIGGVIGWGMERYQLAGGPFGMVVGKVKKGLQKVGTLPTPGAPPAK